MYFEVDDEEIYIGSFWCDIRGHMSDINYRNYRIEFDGTELITIGETVPSLSINKPWCPPGSSYAVVGMVHIRIGNSLLYMCTIVPTRM